MTTNPAEPSPPAPRPASGWIAGLMLVAAAAGLGWWWSQRAPSAPSEEVEVGEERPATLRYRAITRTGTADPLPAPGAAKQQLPCRWLMPLPGLEGLSNKALFDAWRVGDASPLVLARDGVALKPHVQPTAQACDGTWVHAAGGAVVSPTGGAIEGGAWTVGWNPELPARATLDKQSHELWWVYPGTTLRLDFDAAWDPALGEPMVAVDAIAPLGGVGFLVRAGDGELAMAPAATGLSAAGPVPSPAGPWSIEVVAPSGGGPLLVRTIRVGSGSGAVVVLGEAAAEPAVAAPAAGLVLLGDRNPKRVVTPGGPPAALRINPIVRLDKGEGVPRARIKLAPYEALTAPEVKARTERGGCSPLRLTEDGVTLPKPEAAFATLTQVGAGASATQNGAYVFTASDSSDPTKNGRRYAVTLDPERMCGQALWLYPGDTTEVAVDPASLAMASALSLRGAALVGDPAGKQITARLELDGRLALEAAVEVGQLAAGVELPLTAPGPARRVVLTLRNPPEGAFLLFTGASLRGEASVMEGGAGAVAEALVVAEAQAVAQAPAAAVAPPSRGAPPPASAARSLGIDLSVIRQDPKDLRKLALYETKPGDSAWSSVTGPLGPGLRLEASNPEGASRLCTGRFRVQGSGDARVHVSVPTLTNGEGKNRTLTFEVSWFDSSGPILANGKPARAAVNLAAGGWRWEAVPMTPPAGADHAQLCLRFAKSTGAFEVDGLEAGGL